MKVRIRNGFSDRNKIQEISKEIQLQEFTEETRTVLKNYCINLLVACKNSLGYNRYDFEDYISRELAENVFCISLESSDAEYENIIYEFYSVFEEGTYDEILSLLEYLANNLYVRDFEAEERNRGFIDYVAFDVCEDMNEVFEKEFIGYRFIDNIIVPISNDLEVLTIRDAVETKYDKVNEHINKSLKFLGDRNNKDYKNVIKEALCALEGLCSLYSKEETLGKMIGDIADRLGIHEDLKKSIKHLYWFSSDEPGIRHENNKNGNSITFDEAKLVLVECSGIINYLIPVLENANKDKTN